MAAGLGFKTFTTGEVLTAADTNGYLMQGVLVFASAAARDAAITSPQEGQCCYLKDTDAVLTYSGAAWVGFDDSNAIQNSIVDAKGDLVAASGADTPARLAAGNNGEALYADSAATTGLRYSATPSASNPVLNSAFQVWQRGTSTTDTNGDSKFIADRWQLFSGSTGRTFSRQTTSDTTNLPSIQYCMRVARDNGNANLSGLYIGQSFETVNSIPFAGKTVTMSFYGRKGANFSAASSNLTVNLLTGTGTDQDGVYDGYTGQAAPINSTATLTTTWQRFSFTATLSATATEICTSFSYIPVGTAGAADYFEFTGVQVDVGSVALPFRTYAATIQGELAAAQRYFSKSYNTDTAPADGTRVSSVVAVGVASTSRPVTMVRFPVTMRTTPTMTIYATDTGTSANMRDVTAGANVAAAASIIGDTGANHTSVYPNGVSTTANNLLAFHYTASAEL